MLDLRQLDAEGVKFETGVVVGEDLSERYLRRNFDAILLAMGAGEPRGLNVLGAAFDNVHYAMDFLTQQNRVIAGDPPLVPTDQISAQGKVTERDTYSAVLGFVGDLGKAYATSAAAS